MTEEQRKLVLNNIIFEISMGRVYAANQDRVRKTNPNCPSSLEYAKAMLYRAHNLFADIEIPDTPFRTSTEIYDYIYLKLSRHLPGHPLNRTQEAEDAEHLEVLAQTSPSCKEQPRQELMRQATHEMLSTGPGFLLPEDEGDPIFR